MSLADAALLREFIQHVPAAVAMFDRQMRYIFVSERWMEDYRLGDQEIIGRTHYEVFPEIPERWKELHRRALAGEVVRCDEDRFERADGTVDWVRWEIRPWYTISGKVGGVTMFTEVITERKHVEDAIRASETRFRILSTSAPIGIFELDAEGRCQYVNTRWEAITGRTSEEGLGFGWHQTIHPEDREWLLQEARERIRAGFPGEREFRILRPDGSVRWVRVHVAPMVDPQAGRPSGFVGTLDDITAEKEAEEKLQASEQRFMALVNSNIVGIVLGDMSGRIYKANDAFLKMAGYTRADLAAGKVRWSLLTSPESAPEDQRALAELQEKGTAGPWEKEYTRKDGSRVPVLIGLARLGATGSQTIGFVLDLSERKRAEGALRLIAQASRVLASSPDFPDAVNRIAHLLVPTLGDWCVIHVLDEEGNVQRAAVAAADPAQASLARQWMEAPPPAPEAIQPLLQALRTGKTQLLKGVSDELWPAMINSEARVAVMRQVGFHAHAGVLIHAVEEEARHWVVLDDLATHGDNVIAIAGVGAHHAHEVAHAVWQVGGAVGVEHEPVAMEQALLVAEPHVHIGGDGDVALLARLHEGAKQIVLERGVANADLRVVVGHAHIAASMEDDIIDAATLETIRPRLWVEALAYVRQSGLRMDIIEETPLRVVHDSLHPASGSAACHFRGGEQRCARPAGTATHRQCVWSDGLPLCLRPCLLNRYLLACCPPPRRPPIAARFP
ncbi:MAG TPA: PAS domain S-box protein [Armatimonadota bacterium]|nr:PAS domain S-box protein [Armatimonadota bacterium]